MLHLIQKKNNKKLQMVVEINAIMGEFIDINMNRFL
jgi:hypothetical protein